MNIPSEDADKPGLGILPTYPGLNFPNLTFDHANELDAVQIATRALEIKRAVREKYSEYAKCSDQVYGFSGLLGIVARFMRIPSTSIMRIQRIYSDADHSPTN